MELPQKEALFGYCKMKLNHKHIEHLISEGEHQQLDFKFEISDSKKIARTLAAFSNTDGGTLLIGVKDNGAIAGIRSNEEFFMLEAAAQLYCKPEIPFTAKEWNIDGKMILEIKIPRRTGDIVKAPCPDNKWTAYVRVADQNLKANKVLYKYWKKKDKKIAVKIQYKEAEKLLLNYLRDEEYVTIAKFCRLATIPYYTAQNIMVDFMLLKLIDIELSEKQTRYKLRK